jgi:hypothetical protein
VHPQIWMLQGSTSWTALKHQHFLGRFWMTRSFRSTATYILETSGMEFVRSLACVRYWMLPRRRRQTSGANRQPCPRPFGCWANIS